MTKSKVENTKGTMTVASKRRVALLLGLLIGLPALVFGVWGLFEYKQTEGLILSIVSIIVAIFIMVLSFTGIKRAGSAK